MFIELVDALRCPRSHEESWLVASATQMEARHIMRGTLGCPVCLAEYPIEDGVVDFRADRAIVTTRSEPAAVDAAMRMAAMLDLAESTGFAVLLNTWGSIARELAAIVETPLILVNPPGDMLAMPGISVLRCDGDIPLASAAARAVAVDAANSIHIDSAVRITRAKGRLLAPSTLAVPHGVRELARDAQVWVAEREAIASPVVTLHVRRAHT